jgi:uncharacterized protein YbbK (DUF523 family)
MAVIVVSACLLGYPVRYDGSALKPDRSWLGGVAEKHTLCPFCPEAAAGLPTPRPCAEIVDGNGHDVLRGKAEVVDVEGRSCTAAFLLAADTALEVCRKQGASMAILAENSPSCGSSSIHDGTFSGRRKEGVGVTAALLIESGIAVFSQHQLTDIASFAARGTDGAEQYPTRPVHNCKQP